MKFSKIVLSFISFAFVARAQDFESDPSEQDEKVPNVAKFDIEYKVQEVPSFDPQKLSEFDDGDNATINFLFSNHEDVDVTIVGIGGIVVDVYTRQLVANISEAPIAELNVQVNETVKFQEVIQLVLPEGDYYLLPNIFVVKASEFMRVVAPQSLIRINPPPLSYFNPKFLLVQFTFISILAILTYYFFVNFTKSSKVSKKGASSEKTVDASWLPDIHKK